MVPEIMFYYPPIFKKKKKKIREGKEKKEVCVAVASVYWSLACDLPNIKYSGLTVALHMVVLLQNQSTVRAIIDEMK